MTHLLGLTGSIGMGKSTTADMFRAAGVPVWDADETVHRLYDKQGAAISPIADEFPQVIYNGCVDRSKLRHLIADDPAMLKKLEAIVHPLVAKDRAAFRATHDAPLLLFDIPLLYETGAQDWLDSVLVVTAPPAVQKARVMARPGMTEAQFATIISRQTPDKEKRELADHIIATQTLEQTRQAVHDLIDQLTGPTNA